MKAKSKTFKIPQFKPKCPFKKYNKWKELKLHIGGTYIHIREEGVFILGSIKPGIVTLHELIIVSEDLLTVLPLVAKNRILKKSQVAYLLRKMNVEKDFAIIGDIFHYSEKLNLDGPAELDNLLNSEVEMEGMDAKSFRSIYLRRPSNDE
jgi:hypothetical protein